MMDITRAGGLNVVQFPGGWDRDRALAVIAGVYNMMTMPRPDELLSTVDSVAALLDRRDQSIRHEYDSACMWLRRQGRTEEDALSAMGVE